MQTQPIALFHELVAINRRVMTENCDRLQWGMVACWECKAITSYSDQQAEEIMANEEANATKRKQKARQLQQEEQRQRAALAAAAYAANPVLPDMTARFVPQKVTQKKGLCWRCGQMWSLRKDGTIRDHSCTPIVGAVAQQPFGSAHLPVM